MKMIRSSWVLNSMVALAAGLALDAQAADRYVRAGGGGAQNGSDWSNAYPALPATLVRGDTYYVAGGNYPGRTFNTPTSGTTPIVIKKATVADHGTNTGWSDALGTTQAAFSGAFVFTTSNWIIDGQTGGGAENNWDQNFGFKITETGNASAILSLGYSGTADNVTVRHVDLQGKGSVSTQGGGYSNDAVAIYGASNFTLSYFRMKGIGRCPFFISPKNAVFEHGWVESFYGSSDVHSEVASIWGFRGAVGDVTFRHNLITDIQSTGGIMWDNSSNTNARLMVYGNIFYKPPGAVWGRANGVIGGWTSNSAFGNASIYNNTFINVDQDSLSTLPQTYFNNVAFNNLFYNSKAPSFDKFGSHNYNHFVASGTAQGEANGSSVASGDPFVNIAGRDFRLKAPTAGGQSLQAPFNVDAYGKARGADGVADRGALEYSASGSGGVVTLLPPSGLTVQ